VYLVGDQTLISEKMHGELRIKYTCVFYAREAITGNHFVTLLSAVPWLRRLVAGLPLRRPGFDPGSLHVRFAVDKVALGQVFLRVVGFSLLISFHWCSITCKTW
jgi:putative component of membrane protein insertase Oxa1/YidC/SpoIIIJ protein YidD